MIVLYLAFSIGRASSGEPRPWGILQVLRQIPLLGVGVDFMESALEWLGGVYIVNVKYPAMRAQLQGLRDMAKELGILAALTGFGSCVKKLIFARCGLF